MPVETIDTATSYLTPYNDKWTSHEIVHLLKRTMFGAKKADVDHFKNKTLPQTVDELLTPGAFTFPLPVNDYDSLNLRGVMPGKTWLNAPYSKEDDGLRLVSFVKWSMGAFIHQDRSIREKMLLFWHNHFATQGTIGRCMLVWNHHALLRENGLSNFKELTKNITLDGHMLRYLNGEENTKLAPNENYARELQELFCIGKGPDAKFTEDDVKQAAKVLTGWKVDLDNNKSYFKEDDHNSSDKTFSAFYHNKIIKGRKGPQAGMDELNELLDMLFDNEETALFICRKLYRWFVYYVIDENIEKNIIAPLAKTLRKNNYEIKPVLKQLFTSTHFFDEAIAGAQVKSPVDFIVGLQREFNVEYAKFENYPVNYSMWLMLLESSGLMGQSYAEPPNVSGWPAYYQSPGYYELWINTSTYPARNEYSSTMVNYGYNREGRFFLIDVVAFANSFTHPADPDALINDSLELLYRVPVSIESKKILKKNILLSGQEQDHYWTDAWNDHINDPGNNTKKAVVEIRLKNLYHYIVTSPEYQLA
jgi:hypothetical protein